MKQDCTADEEEDASDFIPDSSNKKPESAADDEYGSDFLPGSSKEMKDEEVLRPEASYVDKMKFKEMADMFEVLDWDMPQSLEDAKQRIKEQFFSGQQRELHSQKMQNMVEKTIKKYKDLKKLIIDQYSKVEDLIEKDMFVEEMKEIMNTRFHNFAQELETKKKKLNDYTDEFEIVVIGETSAGKSTFLNVLLGKHVLPSHSLHTTSCLCRLHNSVDTHLEFTTENGSVKKIIQIRDPDEFKKTLTEQLKSVNKDDKSLAVIDIYWPIPWLQKNIVLVDTPGIGERDTLTKQVAEYVPTAAGYIFIIDSSRAGGIQEGGIIKLLEVIQLSADKTGSQITDLSNILFVCNKWDQVEDRGDVSQNTQDKLTKYCGPLQDWQTVKFTAKMELKLQEWKANPTKSFEILVGSLEELMVKTIDKRLGEKFQWILNFVTELHSFVDTRVKALLMSKEELDENMKTSKERLANATHKLKDFEEVKRLVAVKGNELVNDLRSYLKDYTSSSKLLNWSDYKQDNYELQLQDRFRDVILEWAETEPGLVKKASDLVEERCRKIQADSSFDSTDIINFDSFKELLQFRSDTRETNFLLRFLQWYREAFILTLHRPNVQMRYFTRKALEIVLSGENLNNFISSSFTHPWQEQLDAFKKNLQNIIDSSSTAMSEIQKDRERKNDVQNKLSCLKPEVTETLKYLQDLEQHIQSTF